ncbi:MAG TPA: hypothetical protein PLI09_09535 [Candidatus Hydrogenedentes bacterium]|nr:hypothetical protein [Candidatus Hydrogenedentota bacterium]
MPSDEIKHDAGITSSEKGVDPESKTFFGEIDTIDDLVKEVPEVGIPKPQSFLEWSGVFQMAVLLGVICLAVFAFIFIWWHTLPTLQSTAQLLSSTTPQAQPQDPEKILQLWTKLQEAHTQTCTSVFQTVVLTGLIPLFTLLAGYVFGKSHAGGNQSK